MRNTAKTQTQYRQKVTLFFESAVKRGKNISLRLARSLKGNGKNRALAESAFNIDYGIIAKGKMLHNRKTQSRAPYVL